MVSSPAPTSTLSSALVSVLVSDLRSTSSSLYGSLASSALASSIDVDDPAGEPLAGLDDLAHALVEVGQVLRGERPGDVEVVVEAVPDRRSDAQLGVRERLSARPARARARRSAGSPTGRRRCRPGPLPRRCPRSGVQARSRSWPFSSRTTTMACGPLVGRPASRTAAPAVVPAGIFTLGMGAAAGAVDTGSPCWGSERLWFGVSTTRTVGERPMLARSVQRIRALFRPRRRSASSVSRNRPSR